MYWDVHRGNEFFLSDRKEKKKNHRLGRLLCSLFPITFLSKDRLLGGGGGGEDVQDVLVKERHTQPTAMIGADVSCDDSR